MPRPPARLANCYVPLPLEAQKGHPTRTDRNTFELRQLCLETSVLPKALGSSLVELGHTKILCQVTIGTTDKVEEGSLECKIKFAPHVGVNAISQRSDAVSPLESTVSAGRLNSQTMTREASLSNQLKSALLPIIPMENFPKCAIEIQITILQDDGSVLTGCVAASSLALVDANVELYDLVTSSTVAVLEGETDDADAVYLADPTEAETLKASAVICLAMTPNHKEVTLWSQSGRLDSSQANQAMELCRDGCRTMHKFMREVWISQNMQP